MSARRLLQRLVLWPKLLRTPYPTRHIDLFTQGHAGIGTYRTSRHERASEVQTRRLWCLLAALVPLVSVPAFAQQWPTKTVRAVVPLSAGSAVDIVPRIVLEQVAAQIGRSIVVENRTGASGTIGIRSVATTRRLRPACPLLRHRANQGVDPMAMGAEEFQTFVNARQSQWRRSRRRSI